MKALKNDSSRAGSTQFNSVVENKFWCILLLDWLTDQLTKRTKPTYLTQRLVYFIKHLVLSWVLNNQKNAVMAILASAFKLATTCFS